MSQDKELVLVDGSAVLYRAFYAIPSLSTKAGEPTNALFGSIRMLKQLASVWKPTHWAVVFDGGMPAHRLALVAEYKANRKPTPVELKAQIPIFKEYLDLAGVACFRVDGQEADDVMATLAAKAEGESERVLLATGDKDMFQLVNDKIGIVPVSGKSAAQVVMGPSAVKEKTGVMPSQVVEWLALTGDASDNIPGVGGIGDKTASKLLAEHGTIFSVLDDLDKLPPGKIRNSLSGKAELIRRNVEMIRLRRDLEVGLDWDKMEFRRAAGSNLRPFFERWELHALAREVAEQELFAL